MEMNSEDEEENEEEKEVQEVGAGYSDFFKICV